MATRQELEAMALAKLNGASAGGDRRVQLEQAALDKLNQTQQAQPQEDQSLLEQAGQFALEKAAAVGSAIDRYSGAPVRSAIGAVQEGQNPLSAYATQFGEDPEKAPTGREIVMKAGLSDNPIFDPTKELDKKLAAQGFTIDEKGKGISPADVAGFGVDVVADPLAFVPVGSLAKVGVRGGGEALNIAAKTSSKALKRSAQAADLLSGTKAATGALNVLEKGVKTAGETGKAITGVVETYFKPTVAKDFAELKDIAVRNGIDPDILPEAVEFGDSSFISRASRAKAAGPLGQPKLENYQLAQSQINDALNKKISDISGIGGALAEKDAGALIRSGYDAGVDDFFQSMDTTYNSIANKNPNLVLDRRAQVKLNDLISEIQSNALKRYKSPINAVEKAEAANILNTVDTILKTGPDFKSSVDLLQRIGKYNYKPSTMLASPIDAAANRKVYGELRDAIIKTVEKVDPKAAADLIENNKAMTEFFGEQSSLSKIVGNKSLSDEGLFKNLVINGDSKKVKALQSVLSPEEMGQLKASFIEGLTKRSDEGLASFRLLQNQLRNKSSVVSTLFNESEIKEVSDILRLGRRMGSPVLSSSETGAANMFADLKNAIPNAIVSDQVINSMKAKARGLSEIADPKLQGAIDSLKGLTNEEVITKINKEKRFSSAKKLLDQATSKNPRSKAAQATSTQETNKKREK